MARLAAVDLGAQSGRVAVGYFDGSRLTVEEVHRFPNGPVDDGGRLRWDFDALWRETVAGLHGAARDGRVDAVGVDSWAVDFGLLDRRGTLVEPPVHYRDPLRAAAASDLYAAIPPRELYDRTGIQLLPINTIVELAGMAARGEPALAAADVLLLVPDLVHERLCGTRVTERTNASTTQCVDAATGAWADDLLERVDVPVRVFPPIVDPGAELGRADAASGIPGAAVIAVATHDTGSAVAAVPLRGPGSVYLSVGTWSLVGVEVRRPLIDDRSYAANLTNEGGVEGTTRLLRNVTGLWLLDECRRAWSSAGRVYSFDELMRLAGEAPPLRSFVDPDAEAFAAPGDMPGRIAAFCRESGQAPPASDADVVRCVLESLALKHAYVVELLREAAGVEPTELNVVGGGSRNELLCRWTAHAAELPVVAGPEEATLIGNLLVQAIALGELASVGDAREVVRASFPHHVYEPPHAPEWREARERFAPLIDAPVEVSA
jgi:rhamnulokinase